MSDKLFQIWDCWTKLKEKKKKFTKTKNQLWLDNAQLEGEIAELKINNSNPYNIENTHFTAKNTHLVNENAKLIANIAKMKRLTYFSELDSDNITKAITFKSSVMAYLLFSKVKKLIKVADLSEFIGNKNNKTINVENWISKMEYKLEENIDYFLIV